MSKLDSLPLPRIALLDPNTTMARAYLLMLQHKSPNLPVQSFDAIVGIVSERDIETLIRLRESSHTPGELIVANFMKSPVKSVDMHADLGTVASHMLSENINALILLRDGDIVGALTKDDLLHVLVEVIKDDRRTLLESLKIVNHAYTQRIQTPLS